MSLAEDYLDLIWPSGQHEGSTPWPNVTGLTQQLQSGCSVCNCLQQISHNNVPAYCPSPPSLCHEVWLWNSSWKNWTWLWKGGKAVLLPCFDGRTPLSPSLPLFLISFCHILWLHQVYKYGPLVNRMLNLPRWTNIVGKRLCLSLIQNVRVYPPDLPSSFSSRDPHNCMTIGTEISLDIQTKVSGNHSLMGSPCGAHSGLGVLSSHPQLPWSYFLCTIFLLSVKSPYLFPKIFFLLFLLNPLPHAFHCLQPFAAESHISTKFANQLR